MTGSTRSLDDWGYEDMSYQQFPPTSGPNGTDGPGVPMGSPGRPPLGLPPMVHQPSEPFAPAPAGGRRGGLIGVGALLLAAGLVAGIVLFLASSSNYDEGVQNLARAPIGCTTSLEFDEAGTYTIYVETRGQIGELRGDCPNADTDYDLGDLGDLADEGLPDVDIMLVDDGGVEVDLDADDSKDYDAAGFVGQSVSSVEIPEAGDYEITATSDENELAVAIGRNPKETAGSMKTMAYLALGLGVVLGGLCLVLGMRRRPARGTGLPPSAPPVGGGGGLGAAPMSTSTYPGQVPVAQPPVSSPPAAPTYQPPTYQPPAPASPPAAPSPTIPMPTVPIPPVPPTPPGPPAGGPTWPAPPGA